VATVTRLQLQRARRVFGLALMDTLPRCDSERIRRHSQKIYALRSNNIVAGLALAGLRCQAHLRLVLISDNILISQNGF
jgi:hypothetical protein